MKYNYSICYPDQSEMEYPEKILSAQEVKKIALNYPWESELQKLKEIDWNKVHYNPSLDFKCVDDNYSFCLTAEGEPEDYSFSVWYNRPIMKKVLFGLLGEKEKFVIIDKRFSKEASFQLLDKFLAKDYKTIETEMNQKD